MPEKLERCVEKLIKEGKTEESAYAICNASISEDGKYTKEAVLDARPIKYEIDENSGFMHVRGLCARSGIQEYLGSELGLDGDEANQVFNVLRPKDEVAASLSSYNGAVMTDDHPESGLVAAGESQIIKGSVSEADTMESDELYIMAKATITDPELIEKIKSGKRELSAGYTRDLVKESGTYNGTDYDFVQRNIKVNHVAVVDEGRCGDSCKLNIDNKGVKRMKINLDGKTVEMDDNGIQSYIKELTTSRDEAMAESEEVKKKSELDQTEIETLKAAIEAKAAELATLTEKLSDMLTPEEAEEMAEEMAELTGDAEELGVETKEKGMDAKRKEILAAIVPASQKDSVMKLEGDALKSVYAISVDTAKAAKKAQVGGYKGTNDGKVVTRTGDIATDMNAIAKAARAEKKQGDK